jgi:endogenous inhibitor of DNA gyrase (YacG/DUF329 family)
MNESAQSPEKPADAKRCPICGKPREERYRPFCSRRCADVDLHRWLSGRYAVPAVEQDDEAEELRDDGRPDE